MSSPKSLRWSKFWWEDYERDPALRSCSLAAQGLWMRMLCFMHEATPYGHLTVNGKVPDSRRLAAMVGKAEREIVSCLAELEEAAVFSRTDDGVIYSRRLTRDKAISEEAKVYGAKGGNPALKADTTPTDNGSGGGGGLTPPVILQEAEAKKQESKKQKEEPPYAPPLPALASPQAAQPTTNRDKRGCALPNAWEPSEMDRQFAFEQRLDPDMIFAEFRDYWRSVPGVRGRKLDWSATFRNRCRQHASRGRPTTRLGSMIDQVRQELGLLDPLTINHEDVLYGVSD